MSPMANSLSPKLDGARMRVCVVVNCYKCSWNGVTVGSVIVAGNTSLSAIIHTGKNILSLQYAFTTGLYFVMSIKSIAHRSFATLDVMASLLTIRSGARWT
jgi:hypothetical protein